MLKRTIKTLIMILIVFFSFFMFSKVQGYVDADASVGNGAYYYLRHYVNDSRPNSRKHQPVTVAPTNTCKIYDYQTLGNNQIKQVHIVNACWNSLKDMYKDNPKLGINTKGMYCAEHDIAVAKNHESGEITCLTTIDGNTTTTNYLDMADTYGGKRTGITNAGAVAYSLSNFNYDGDDYASFRPSQWSLWYFIAGYSDSISASGIVASQDFIATRVINKSAIIAHLNTHSELNSAQRTSIYQSSSALIDAAAAYEDMIKNYTSPVDKTNKNDIKAFRKGNRFIVRTYESNFYSEKCRRQLFSWI